MRTITIADRIEETGGRPTGFDYLRIILAISIVAWHTVQTSYGPTVAAGAWLVGWRPMIGLLLPMFFALSGFLVAGSLERTPQIIRFLGLRALRIYPALIAETLLSAFILGPLLTKLPLPQYFAGREFSHYLLNCFGIIHYTLPGLFASNPDPRIVNVQLWTVPFELQCYLLLAALALVGVAMRRHLILGVSIALQVAILISGFFAAHGHFLTSKGPVNGWSLVMVFLAGVSIFSMRRAIVMNAALFFVAFILSLIALSIPLGDYLLPYPVAYMTVYLGFTNIRATFIHKLGDLSYGIFLYGFPMQQVVASLGSWSHHWYVSFPISLAMAIVVAWLSWHVIERPALSLKRHLVLIGPLDLLLENFQNTARITRLRILQVYRKRPSDRLIS